MEDALAYTNRARRALDKARTIDEVKDVRDKAEALRLYVKQAGYGLEMQNTCAEIKLRAERKVGGLLKKTAKTGERDAGKGGDRRSQSQPATVKLDSIGITRSQSSRWQQEAELPEATFEKHIVDTKAGGGELTSASVMRLARDERRDKDRRAEGARDSPTGTVDDLDRLVSDGHRFGTIYADPPWNYDNVATRASADRHYATQGIEWLESLPVEALAAEQAHLHLWTTNAFIFEARRLLDAWGFTYKSCFVWVKPQMGIGNYWRVSHEFLLLGVRGGLTFADRSCMSWGLFPRRKHSEKPGEVRQLIERASPTPRLELFARVLTDGWASWGDEITGDALPSSAVATA